MKRNLMMMALSFLCLSIPLSGARDRKKDREQAKQERIAEVASAIACREFIVEVDWAYPMSGRAVNLTTLYSVKVMNDTISSYLPYFGKAYSIPYGGGSGYVFDSMIEDYVEVTGKKGQKEISFETDSEEDRCRYSITVFPEGGAEISVTSNDRQPISYRGQLSPLREKKTKADDDRKR